MFGVFFNTDATIGETNQRQAPVKIAPNGEYRNFSVSGKGPQNILTTINANNAIPPVAPAFISFWLKSPILIYSLLRITLPMSG